MDYTITITSLSDSAIDYSVFTQLVSGTSTDTTYTQIPVDSGSVISMTADSSDLNYILSVDDDGDGQVDRLVLPDGGFFCGDANGNAIVNIADVVYLIQYIFAGGPPPVPLASGDVNCNGIVNIADVVYLIQYIFSGGPEPCAAC